MFGHTLRRLIESKSLDQVLQLLRVFFVRGLGATSMFLLYAVVARRLEITEAGYFLIGLSTVRMLLPISAFGLQFMSLRLISARSLDDDAGEINYLARHSFWMSLLTSSLMAVAFFFATPWLAQRVFAKPEIINVLRWMAPSIALGCVGLVKARHLQAIKQFVASLTVLSISTPLVTAIALLLISQPDAVTSSMVYFSASVGTVVIGAGLWRYFCPPVLPKRVEVSGFLSSCYALWAVSAMIVIVDFSGPVIAGAFADAADVAVLAVALRTANLINFILIGVDFVVAPKFAKYWANGDTAAIRNLALKSTACMYIGAVPLFVVISVFPSQIMSLFGSEFSRGGTLLVILAFSQFFNVITGSVNPLLAMCGFEHDLRRIVLTSGLLSVVLSVLLTRAYGVQGAAIATASALAVQNLYAVWMVKKRLGFSMFSAAAEMRTVLSRQPC